MRLGSVHVLPWQREKHKRAAAVTRGVGKEDIATRQVHGVGAGVWRRKQTRLLLLLLQLHGLASARRGGCSTLSSSVGGHLLHVVLVVARRVGARAQRLRQAQEAQADQRVRHLRRTQVLGARLHRKVLHFPHANYHAGAHDAVNRGVGDEYGHQHMGAWEDHLGQVRLARLAATVASR